MFINTCSYIQKPIFELFVLIFTFKNIGFVPYTYYVTYLQVFRNLIRLNDRKRRMFDPGKEYRFTNGFRREK